MQQRPRRRPAARRLPPTTETGRHCVSSVVLAVAVVVMLLLPRPSIAFLVVVPSQQQQRRSIASLPRPAAAPAAAAPVVTPSPSLTPTPEQLEELKREEEADRKQRLEFQRRLDGQRLARVTLEGLGGGSSVGERLELLGRFTDLLIEGGALEVSYATTTAALEQEEIRLSVTVPSGEGEGEGEGVGVDLEGLLCLAREALVAAEAAEGAALGRGAASSLAWRVEEQAVPCGLDWMRAGEEEGFEPVLRGKFQIVPVQRSGLVPLRPPAEHEVRILAGEGWGTGQHPTTRLCLDFLSREGAICGGERVIDYGCGSGILSIAALQLGAREAVGVDIEYEALASAKANAQLNDVEDEVALLHAREVVPGEFAPGDVVLANILVGVLLRMANTIIGAVKPGGWLVLSGLRPEQLDAIKRKYSPHIDFDESLEAMEEVQYASWGTGAGWWCRLVGRRRAEASSGGGDGDASSGSGSSSSSSSWIQDLSEAAVS